MIDEITASYEIVTANRSAIATTQLRSVSEIVAFPVTVLTPIDEVELTRLGCDVYDSGIASRRAISVKIVIIENRGNRTLASYVTSKDPTTRRCSLIG
jgi:hypothetical protein